MHIYSFFFKYINFGATFLGFGQVSKRYMSKNSQCQSIASVISTALTIGFHLFQLK